MIQRWILSLVIGFVMRQLAKWKKGIDWEKVKTDFQERVKALVPGEWLDSEAAALAGTLIDMVVGVLGANAALERLIELAVDQKYQEAWTLLRDLILSLWKPEGEMQVKVYAAVKEMQSIG